MESERVLVRTKEEEVVVIMVRAGRHLENYCDEVGHNSIKERSLEKSVKRIKHEEDTTAKGTNFQVELGAATVQTKCKIGVTQQKLPSKLSYQDKCYSLSPFIHLLIIASPFNEFRDDAFLQTVNDFSG